MIFHQTRDRSYIDGTSFHHSTVSATAIELTELFGPSEPTDEYKVSHEWIFRDEDGNGYTVYDYKQTLFYDPALPSPDKFSSRVYDWHIGGKSPELTSVFAQWLKKQLAALLVEPLEETI